MRFFLIVIPAGPLTGPNTMGQKTNGIFDLLPVDLPCC